MPGRVNPKITTRNAAAVIGRSAEFRTFESGKAADIATLDGNPRAYIHDVLTVRMVIMRGAVVVGHR